MFQRTITLYRPFFLACLLLVFCCSIAGAQWYGAGTQRTESSVPMPPLSVLPELHTDMSLDCFVGYIAGDSISKSARYSDLFFGFNNNKMDVLRYSARFMYAMKDYNPILFRRYIHTSSFMDIPNVQYQSYVASSYYGIEDELKKRIDEFGRGYAMLVAADYILHIEVADVAEGIDSTFSSRTLNYNVAASVLGKIKGQYLPVHCVYPHQANPKRERVLGGYENGSTSATCIKFGHPKRWPAIVETDGDVIKHIEGEIRPAEIGDEYIAFLTLMAIDESTDSIFPLNTFEANGGLFRIVDGKVEDPSNVFGLGTAPTVADFKQHLATLIQNIKSWQAPQ